MNIKDKLNVIFKKVFNDDSIQITPETTANDIEGWDSLSHMTLIVAIESKLKITFTQQEALTFKNVNDLIKCIERKI